MTKTVTLLQPARDENNVQRLAGQSFDCSDTYAEFLVNNNIAAYVGSNYPPARFNPSFTALVSGDGTLISLGSSSSAPRRTSRLRGATFSDSTGELVAGGFTDISYYETGTQGAWQASGTYTLPHPASGQYELQDLYPSISTVGDGGVGGENLTQMLARDAAATSATVTISQASPGVFTKTAHGFVTAVNTPIVLTTTGALPAGLSPNVAYYVNYINANTFSVSATPGGTAINTTDAGSGVHTYAWLGRKAITDLCNLKLDFVSVRAGINTVTNSAIGTYVTVATAAALQAQTIIQRFASAGVFVFFRALHGYSAGTAGYSGAGVAADPPGVRLGLLLFNSLMQTYCEANPTQCRYVDLLDVTYDSTGACISPNLSTDGLHLNSWGQHIASIAEVAEIEDVFGPSQGICYPGINLVSDPFFNTVSSGVCTNLTIGTASNCSASGSAIEVIDGQTWQTTIVTPTTAAACSIRMGITVTPAQLAASVGDYFGVEVDVYLASTTGGAPPAGMANTTQVRFAMVKTAAGTISNDLFSYSRVNAGFTGSAPWKRHCWSVPMKMLEATAALSGISFYFQAGSDGTSPFKMGISQPRIVKIAAP